MAPTTPYTPQLAGRDPLDAMAGSAAQFEQVTKGWTAPDFERALGPGKWTARLILIHLAQSEIAFGSRARLALSTPDYASQNFDQDAWLPFDEGMSGPDVALVLIALMHMNLAMYRRLTSAQREIPFSHPQYGALTVDWIIHQQAGHHIHHLKQLQGL
jgi:hypothetical protein